MVPQGQTQASTIDLIALIDEVLGAEPDSFASLGLMLNHARLAIECKAGAVLKRGDVEGPTLVVSHGRMPRAALSAFHPGTGELAAAWDGEQTELKANVALLSHPPTRGCMGIAYATLPLGDGHRAVILLLRPLPPGLDVSECFSSDEIDAFQGIIKVGAPLLGFVDKLGGLRRELTELRRLNQDAKAAVRAREAFLAHLSHDLQTPLSAIIGFAQLLEMERLTSEQRDYVGNILSAGFKLHKLVTQAIDVAYAASGKLTLMMQPVDVLALTRDCVNMLREDALAAEVTVNLTPAKAQQDLVVLTDAQRFTQIVLNLLSNAIKVSPRRQVVNVDVAVDEELIRVMVQDQGPGIAPHVLPRLFVPYSNASPDGSSESGLGLPLSHALATALGGSLTVRSERGRGACFTLTLPRR